MTKRRTDLRRKVLLRDGACCAVCGADCSAPVETGWKNGRTDGAAVDHRVPLWLGGGDTLRNARVLCEACHKAKTRREAGLRRKLKRKAAKLALHRKAMRAKGGNGAPA